MPGRINTCSPAVFAVSVRRGSTTNSRAPRASSSLSAAIGAGTCRKLHFDTAGLAPTTIRQRVRSRSGNGCVKQNPYMCCATANLLAQSCVADEYKLLDPSPCMNPDANTGCSTPKPAAVPTYMAIESGDPARSARSFAPISASAWSHEIRTCRPSTRFSGYSRRSGESYKWC